MVLIFLLPLYFREWSLSFGVEASILTAVFLLVLQQFGLPFDWYRQFRLEDKFGFLIRTKRLWLSDKCKEFVLGCFLITFVTGIGSFPLCPNLSNFPALLVGFCFPCLLSVPTRVLMVLWPRFIIPLFNTLKPLEDSDLREKLHALSEKTRIQNERNSSDRWE